MANKSRKATPARKKKSSRTPARPDVTQRTDGQSAEAANSEKPRSVSVRAAPTPLPANRVSRSAWPTRRLAASAHVQLPVEDVEHVRTDLARIAVLSGSIVAILIVLTFFLR